MAALQEFLDRAQSVYTHPWAQESAAPTASQVLGQPSTQPGIKDLFRTHADKVGSVSIKAPEPTYRPEAQAPGVPAPPVGAGQAKRGQNFQVLNGGYSGKYTGKMGPGAYGFSGTTGLPKFKGTGPKGIQQEFWTQLNQMFTAMKAEGIEPPVIGGGFRDYAGQVAAKARWTKAGKPQNAASPGRSVHGLGYAVDLSTAGGASITNQQYQWMKANAHKWGVINLPSERWHWQLDPRYATTVKTWR